MSNRFPTQAEVDALVARTEEATNAFLDGDMDRYLELTPHVPGFSLANPFGGRQAVYADRAPSLREAAGYFQGGTARVELVAWHATGDALVLVTVEHQRAKVGGLPEQEWPLRVTSVYLRAADDWHLAHRHADPLYVPVGLDGAARLARGEGR